MDNNSVDIINVIIKGKVNGSKVSYALAMLGTISLNACA